MNKGYRSEEDDNDYWKFAISKFWEDNKDTISTAIGFAVIGGVVWWQWDTISDAVGLSNKDSQVR